MKIYSVEAIAPEPLSVDAQILFEESEHSEASELGVVADAAAGERGVWEDRVHTLAMPASERDPGTALAAAVWQAPRIVSVDVAGDEGTVVLARHDEEPFTLKLSANQAGAFHPGDRVMGTEFVFLEGRFFVHKVRVDFVPDPAASAVELPTALPLVRLHCPRRDGCTADYAIDSEREESIKGSIEFAGIGGGGGQTITYTLGQKWSTDGPKCLEVYVPATVVVEFGATRINGTPISYGFRAHIKEVQSRTLANREIPKELDHCLSDDLPSEQSTLFESYAHTTGELVCSFSRKKAVEGTVTVGLDLGAQSPVKIGIECTQKYSEDVKITTKLATGATYQPYAPRPITDEKSFLELCWATSLH